MTEENEDLKTDDKKYRNKEFTKNNESAVSVEMINMKTAQTRKKKLISWTKDTKTIIKGSRNAM